MDQPTFDILISAQPKLTAPATPEPSLRQMVLEYYSTHCPADMARQYAEEYFTTLKSHIG